MGHLDWQDIVQWQEDEATVDVTGEAGAVTGVTHGDFQVAEWQGCIIALTAFTSRRLLSVEWGLVDGFSGTVWSEAWHVEVNTQLIVYVPHRGPFVRFVVDRPAAGPNGTHDLQVLNTNQHFGHPYLSGAPILISTEVNPINAGVTDTVTSDIPYAGAAWVFGATTAAAFQATLQGLDVDGNASRLWLISNDVAALRSGVLLIVPRLILQVTFQNNDAAARNWTFTVVPAVN